MKRQSRRVFTGGGLLAALLSPWKAIRADGPGAPEGPELTLKELSAQLDHLRKQYESMIQDLNAHAVLDPPVGGVVAYAGHWPPINPATNQARTEAEIGWALCDGRSFTHPSLAKVRSSLEAGLGKVLGTQGLPVTNLPDLQGQFLRGCEYGIRGPLTRQGFATAMPRNRFLTEVQPEFDPANGDYAYLLRLDGTQTATQGDDGPGEPNIFHTDHVRHIPAHNHVITGGDAETRPINVAVHYIIKFRAAPSR